MAIKTKNIPSLVKTVAKFGGSRFATFGGSRFTTFGGKHGSDSEEKKAIQSLPDAAIEGSMEGKSLYLAFSHIMLDGPYYFVVKSIKLSDVTDGRRSTFVERTWYSTNSSSSTTDCYSINSISSKLLRIVGYTPPMEYGPSFENCGLFGSSIVFGGIISEFVRRSGDKEIWAFKADGNLKPHLRIKPFLVHTFNYLKYSPHLVELQDKLYALNGLNITDRGGFIEVFDPTQRRWLSLPDPPILNWKRHEDISMVVAGQKILCSNPDVRGVVCFEPEIQNWKPIHSLGAGLPFEGFVKAFDDDAWDGFLILDYTYREPGTILVFFMSHQFDPVQTLKSVELPFLPYEFDRCSQFSFVRLGDGGRKFCLVLNCFFTKDKSPYKMMDDITDRFPQHRNKGFLLFITFEYEITKSESGSELEGSYKILNINRIEYKPERPKDESGVTLGYTLLNAFVLNDMEGGRGH